MATFDGGTFNLADHHGQVVVVNFWASWCDPCRKEMPAFQEASRASSDVVFVGVGAKTDKDDEAHAFAEEFGITYPIGRDTEGGTAGYGQIATDYGIYGYPATYFIDPEGNISATVLGELDVSQLQSYIDQAKGE
jgi:thiol-disulfide isomerase/thioredoxin